MTRKQLKKQEQHEAQIEEIGDTTSLAGVSPMDGVILGMTMVRSWMDLTQAFMPPWVPRV